MNGDLTNAPNVSKDLIEIGPRPEPPTMDSIPVVAPEPEPAFDPAVDA